MTKHGRLVAVFCLAFLATTGAAATPPPPPPAVEAPADDISKLGTLVDARDFEAAADLSATLLADPPTDPERETRLLDWELKRQYRSGDISRLAEVEPRAKALAENPAVPLAQRVSMLHNLMTVHTRVPRLDDAIATLDTMIAMLGDEPSAHLLDALSAKGGVHAMQGQFPEAIEALLRADNVNRALDIPYQTGILRNLSGIFMQLGENDRAIEYAQRGEVVSREAHVTPAQRKGMLAMLATAHIAAGHFEQGEHWSQQAIAFGEANGLGVSSERSNYATLLRDNGRHQEALAIYRQLVQDYPQDANPELRGVLEKNIGETLVALGRRAEADTHLQRAKDIYSTMDFRPKRLELYPVLIENLEALGRSDEALAAMREYKDLNDEAVTAEAQVRLGELEATIDLNRKSQELAEAEIANERQRLENLALQAGQDSARATNLALGVCLLAAIAVLVLLWRTHRLRTRSHRELSARNAEIEEQRNALEALNATIHQQSREDALTGLGNRRYLLEQLQSIDGSESDLVVMADLDHFKRINDEHGHHVGDKALRHFADALRAVGRQGDLLARWGGEEFIWVCRGAGADQGPALCGRLQRHLREHPLRVDGDCLPITTSLGFVPVPVWPGARRHWELALRIADHGVYASKAAGRDCWTGFLGNGAAPASYGASPEHLEREGRLQRCSAPASGAGACPSRTPDPSLVP